MKWLFIQSFQAMIENVHWNVTFRVQGIDKSVTPHCLYYVIQIMWCFLQFSDDIRRCMYTIYNSIERLNCQFRKVKKTKIPDTARIRQHRFLSHLSKWIFLQRRRDADCVQDST